MTAGTLPSASPGKYGPLPETVKPILVGHAARGRAGSRGPERGAPGSAPVACSSRVRRGEQDRQHEHRAGRQVVVAEARAPVYGAGMTLDRIRVEPGVCEGRPTIRGLRLTVDFVLRLVADGYSVDDIVREYPELEREDVLQSARYGAWLASERTSAVA